MMKVLSKSQIETVFNRFAEAAEVYVPMLRGPMSGFFNWKSYNEDYDDLSLDQLNVYMPPKQVVISPREKSVIDLTGDSMKPQTKIIFGARGCDVQGINYLDEVFAEEGFESAFYGERRDKTIIVANACYFPAPSCFCTSMGGNPTDPNSADVIIRDVGAEGYVWDSCSEKGRVLTAKIADILEEKVVEIPQLQPFSLKVEYEGVMEKIRDMYDQPLWEKLSESCQTCALCTYSCPTCYCLDEQVKHWGDEGYLFSCHDTCAYQNQTMITEGSSPREAATGRFRNRFLHKLQFYPERYGKLLCTGCGRCIGVCPAGTDISRIITAIKQDI